jgi:hypothetical protein
MFVDGVMTAGFCLVPGFLQLRAVMQLPTEKIKTLIPTASAGLADFTGYFMKDKRHAFRFTCYLTKVCFLHPCKYFIYSYQTTEVGLGRYYAAGNPLRIHTGIPEHLDGHHAIMEPEHVEILSKWGIVKIFLRRTFKMLGKILIKHSR